MYPISDSALRWLELILGERFGHTWCLNQGLGCLQMNLQGEEGLIIFDKLEPSFTEAHSNQGYTKWDAEKEGWTSILGGPLPTPGTATLPEPLIEQQGTKYVIHYDILGLTYWMLARIEELGRTEHDKHERFPVNASHAFKFNYLDRPVVDEWLAVLKQVILKQWPTLKLKHHNPKVRITCDLDNPYLLDYSAKATIRGFIKDIVKLRNPATAFKNFYIRLLANLGNFTKDTNLANIDWIMDVNEEVGNCVTFYFMINGDHPYDGRYRIDQPVIRKLLRKIHHRGHTIGLHPSYMSYLDEKQIRKEADTLRHTLENEGISQTKLASRQHYLRWKTGQTARNLESADISYDSTLTYAELPGFRCGTSFEFTMFDVEHGCVLNLKQQPLIVMETTIIDNIYMSVKEPERQINIINNIKKRALLTGGQFTLLWHNCSLNTKQYRKIYQIAVENHTDIVFPLDF